MRRILPAFVLTLAVNFLFGQSERQKLVAGDTLNLTGRYNVSLSEAIRVPTGPQFEVPEITPPVLEYDKLELKPAEVKQVIEIPKAEKMPKEAAPKFTNNYIKVGFGNQLMPLANVYFASPANKKYLAGLNYRHLSANGPNFQDFSSNTANIYGTRFYKQGDLSGSFRWNREKIYYYGYDREKYPNPSKDTLGQHYQLFEGKAAYEVKKLGRKKDYARVDIGYYNLGDAQNQQENDLNIQGLGIFKINKNALSIGLAYNFQGFANDSTSVDRNFIHLTPSYIIKSKQYRLELGFVSSLIVPAGSNTLFYFFPDVKGEYITEDGNISVFGGFTGGVMKNSFREYSERNPFVAYNPDINLSINRFQFDAGIRGKLSNKFGAAGRLFYNQYNDLPLFITDTMGQNRFMVIRDDVQLIRLNVEFNYLFSEKFRSSLAFNYYNYSMTDQEKPWMLPDLDLTWNSTYNLGDKLLFGVDIFVTGKRYNTIAYTDSTIELSPIFDASLSIDYRYKKNISAFVKLNNLAAQHYQYWSNYPVYGFNFILGVAIGL